MHVVRVLFLIIIFCYFLEGCKKKIGTIKVNSESTIIEEDSIYKIVEKLCGDWEVDKIISQKYLSNGTALGTMSIYCWVNVDNYKLVNEVIINKVWSLRDINNEEPTSIDSLFLPASDSVVVSREKQYYGLKYTNGENIQFIPIKQINDSILLLQDGRKFVRIN